MRNTTRKIRFETLEEVLDHYDQHVKESSTLDPLIREASNEPFVAGQPPALHMTPEEKAAVIAFLHTLTDEAFLTNPAHRDPNETTSILPSIGAPAKPVASAEQQTVSGPTHCRIRFRAEMAGEPFPRSSTFSNPTGLPAFFASYNFKTHPNSTRHY